MNTNNFDKEAAKRYSAEGLDGLVKNIKANPLIGYALNSGISSDAKALEAFLAMQIYSDLELRNRFNVVSTDITLNAIIKELIPDKQSENQPEQPEPDKPDAVQEAVDYLKNTSFYAEYKSDGDKTESALQGCIVLTYLLDRKFRELCYKAGFNGPASAIRVISTRLLEQNHE